MKQVNSFSTTNKVTGNSRRGGSFAEQLHPKDTPGNHSGTDLHNSRYKSISISDFVNGNYSTTRFASRVAKAIKEKSSNPQE